MLISKLILDSLDKRKQVYFRVNLHGSKLAFKPTKVDAALNFSFTHLLRTTFKPPFKPKLYSVQGIAHTWFWFEGWSEDWFEGWFEGWFERYVQGLELFEWVRTVQTFKVEICICDMILIP